MYITSAAECAPPGDRMAAEEAANRPPWLKAELEIMRPRAVVALGGAAELAVSSALGSKPPEFVRGAFAGVESVRVYASYHPSRCKRGRALPRAVLDVARTYARCQ